MEKLVRRGDPAAFYEWWERQPPDEEFARLLDEVVEESRKGLRLKTPRL